MLCVTLIHQRQRERFQIEPADPFGVVRIQAMPIDAMLSEFAAASTQLAGAQNETVEYPQSGVSAANVSTVVYDKQ